jgi:hypothetical protein
LENDQKLSLLGQKLSLLERPLRFPILAAAGATLFAGTPESG